MFQIKQVKLCGGQSCRTFWAIITIVVVCAILFKFSIDMRQPVFDVLSQHGDNGSTSLLNRAINWYEVGPLNLKFGMFNEMRTIENENVFTQENLYRSFLPGQIIPIYLIAKLFDQPPQLFMLVGYNLFAHFVTTCLLALSIFFLLRQIKLGKLAALAFAFIPVYLQLFLPGPLTLHHVFFTNEQALLPLFAVMIFMEVLIDGTAKLKTKQILTSIQAIVMFGGLLVSWFFILVAIIIYGKRIFLKSFRPFSLGALFHWLPVVLAIFLYLIQQGFLYSWLGGSSLGTHLIEMFVLKSGLSDAGNDYVRTFIDSHAALNNAPIGISTFCAFLTTFVDHFSRLFGCGGIYLLISTLIITAIAAIKIIQSRVVEREAMVKLLSSMCLLILPNILWCLVFRNQVAHHKVELLKFSFLASAGFFVLGPLTLYYLLLPWLKKRFTESALKSISVWAIAFVFALSFLYLYSSNRWTKMLYVPTSRIKTDIQRVIQKNTDYQDIVFTTIYDDPTSAVAGTYDWPLLATTKKKLYVIYSPRDILAIVKDCSAAYTVNILSSEQSTAEKNFKLYNFLSHVPHSAKRVGNFYLYKIAKADFLAADKALFGNPDEKMLNGDFAIGITGWVPGPNVTLETATEGVVDKALKIKLNATSSSGAYQAIHLKPGKSYALNFYQKDGNANSTYCFGSTPGGQEIKACQDISNAKWTKYHYTFTASMEMVYIQFYTRFNAMAGDYSFFDEVSLIESDPD